MPVDQIGLGCDIDGVNQVAKRHGIEVVEDAAPTIGGTYKGRRVGSNAHQTVFSFHPRKVITTGEGGMITTDDDALADKARKLRAHAMSVSDLDRHKADRPILESYDELGFNYRMTDIQASIGLVQIRRLDELLRIRVAKADRYGRELADLKKVRTPYSPSYATHTYQSYCLDLDTSIDRDDLMARLLRRGVATRRGVMASHLEKVYRDRVGTVSLPITEQKARSTMLIPLFATMTDDEQTYVIESLRDELRAA
jgi:dTDP-4-amino-4,6-dideoxygalactose transaminase